MNFQGICVAISISCSVHIRIVFLRGLRPVGQWSKTKHFARGVISESETVLSKAERSNDFGQQNMFVCAWLRSAVNVSGNSADALRDDVVMLHQ